MFAPTPCIYWNNIIIPVVVLPPLIAGGQPRLSCPPFIVPAGSWTLVWNLVSIHHPESVHATFPSEDGIKSQILGQSQNFLTSTRISDTQWAVSLIASCESKVSPFLYVISILYPTPGEPNGLTLYTSEDRNVIRHDPTIVIAHDPIEPPT